MDNEMDKQLDTSLGINREKWYLCVSFALPFVLVLLGYLFMGIYPFGDGTILIMDLHGQYFPMINNLKTAIYDGDLLHSFSAGLGFNLIAQNAYYANSIFWYLIALLPSSAMIPAFHFVVALRFGLSGLAFSLFLKKKFKELSALTVALSLAYSLSAYTLAYISQTMWGDAVFLFPIVLLGLEMMLEESRPLVYTISLSLLIISNFYIGFSVCLFTFLYFVTYEMSQVNKLRIRAKRFGIFSLYSLLSGATAAVFLIPTYLAITGTKAGSLGFEGEVKKYHSLEEVIERMMPFSGNELEYGAPNLYCGVFILICVFLYIFCGKLALRKRVAHMFLFTFMLLSFEINILDFVFHGFHYPNQLPGRYSFVYVFLALLIAYEALRSIDCIKLPYLTASVALPILLLLLIKNRSDSESNLIFIGILLIAMYAVIILLPKNVQKGLASSLIALVVIFEVGCNAMYVLGTQSRTYSYNAYTSYNTEMKELTEKYGSTKNDFYRSEGAPYLSFNAGQLYGFNGISYYSSMMSGEAYDFFGNIGFGIYAKNVSSVYSPTPVTNTMLGVKYIYERYGEASMSSLPKVESLSNITLRENKYYLPFSFAVSEGMLEFENKEYPSHMMFQNEFYKATGATDEDVFKKVQTRDDVKNASVVLGSDGNKYYMKNGEGVSCSFSYIVDKSGDYFVDSAFRGGELKLYINGIHTKTFSTAFHRVYFLGNYPVGTSIRLELTANYSYALYGADFYYFDEEAFSKGYEVLSSGAASITSATPSRLKADIKIQDGQMLYASLADDGGWSLYVDGKKTELLPIADLLCGAKLEPGEHAIEFRYTPPGFVLGLTLSIAAIASVILIEILKKKKA